MKIPTPYDTVQLTSTVGNLDLGVLQVEKFLRVCQYLVDSCDILFLMLHLIDDIQSSLETILSAKNNDTVTDVDLMISNDLTALSLDNLLDKTSMSLDKTSMSLDKTTLDNNKRTSSPSSLPVSKSHPGNPMAHDSSIIMAVSTPKDERQSIYTRGNG